MQKEELGTFFWLQLLPLLVRRDAFMRADRMTSVHVYCAEHTRFEECLMSLLGAFYFSTFLRVKSF